MIMWLYFLTLSFCSSLVSAPDPIARHGELATAIATTIWTRGPLFRGDRDGKKTAALMVAIAFRESTLDNGAVGDHGRSFCAFQVHRSSGGSPDLCEDVIACAEKAYTMLKESMRIDPDHPVAFYARGPRFRTLEAQRISNDRMMVAKRLAGVPF